MIHDMIAIIDEYWLLLLIGQYPNGPLGGLANTLILSALSIVLAFPFAILLAFARPGLPEHPVITPRTLDVVRGYRVRGSDTVLDAGEQRELAIGFGFGGDADVIILDAQ